MMVFHWSLSDNTSPQIPRTLLSILTDLNNAVVWTVSSCLVIYKSSRPCTNPLVTVIKAPIAIGIIVTFMFHSFFSSLARSRYLPSFCILSTLLCGQPGQQSPQSRKFSLFCWVLLGLVFGPRLGDPFVCQNLRGVCACHSLRQILGCADTICLYGQTSISSTIPSRSSCPPSLF